MKRFVRFVCFLVITSLILAMPAAAAETVSATENAARGSNYFWSCSVYLYRTSDTTFEAWFDVVGTGTMLELGASVIKIQRSDDGVNWDTMRTYRKEVYPGMIYENTARHAYGVSYTCGTPGCYYRAFVILYAKNSSGHAEMYEYTSVMQL